MPEKTRGKSATPRKTAKSSSPERGRKAEKVQARERNGGSRTRKG